MAYYNDKVNFNPLSKENSVNYTHKLLKTEKNELQLILIISKRTFEWCSFDFLCSLALYNFKLFNFCTVHSKYLKFKYSHHQCSDLMLIKFQVHIKRSNMMNSFRNLIL